MTPQVLCFEHFVPKRNFTQVEPLTQNIVIPTPWCFSGEKISITKLLPGSSGGFSSWLALDQPFLAHELA